MMRMATLAKSPDSVQSRASRMKYLIYLLWITVYARSSSLRAVLDGVSRNQRVFLLVVVAFLVVGQLSQSKSTVYPMVYWGMYSEIDVKGKVYDYRGIRADGSEVRLPMTRLVRTHSKRFVWRLRSLARDIGKADTDEERAQLEALYDEALRSAWALYRSRELGEEIVAIRVHRTIVSVEGYESPEGMEQSVFREVEL